LFRDLRQQLGREEKRREDALRLTYEKNPRVWVIAPTVLTDPDDLRALFREKLGEARVVPVTEAEQKEYAEKAIAYLARMARGELPGYDVGPVADAVYQALRAPGKLSPEGLSHAVAIVARLPGARPQAELANVVLDPKFPLPLRIQASSELIRHAQQHSVALNAAQITALADLLAKADTDAGLKAALSGLVGTLRPDARTTGDRLLMFPPPQPGPPPKEKDKEKDKEK
jgi:hypothetical protein